MKAVIEGCSDYCSVDKEAGWGAGKMLFVAAIRGTQAVWRRLLSVTVLHQQWGCKCRSFPVCGLFLLCAVWFFLLSVCRRFFSLDANTDKSFKCVFQASLAQRLCSGADRGSVSQLSLYTSPSLPNITLGLPATATATAASNVRRKLDWTACRLCISLTVNLFCLECTVSNYLFKYACTLFSRWPQPNRMEACSQPSPSALHSSPVATWPPTWPRLEQEQAGTVHTVPCSNTWCSWSRVQRRAPWWQVGETIQLLLNTLKHRLYIHERWR